MVLLIAVVFILFAVPSIIAIILNRFLRKKGHKTVGAVILILTPLITFLIVYFSLFSNALFPKYHNDFSYVTLRKIPESAVVIKKSASDVAFNGDHVTASLIKLSQKDYDKLLNDLIKDKRFFKNPDVTGSHELSEVMEGMNNSQLKYKFRLDKGRDDCELYIFFLDDNQSVIIYECIW